jgi:hypothetical protein
LIRSRMERSCRPVFGSFLIVQIDARGIHTRFGVHCQEFGDDSTICVFFTRILTAALVPPRPHLTLARGIPSEEQMFAGQTPPTPSYLQLPPQHQRAVGAAWRQNHFARGLIRKLTRKQNQEKRTEPAISRQESNGSLSMRSYGQSVIVVSDAIAIN